MLGAINTSSTPTPALLTCLFFTSWVECVRLTTLLHVSMYLNFSQPIKSGRLPCLVTDVGTAEGKILPNEINFPGGGGGGVQGRFLPKWRVLEGMFSFSNDAVSASTSAWNSRVILAPWKGAGRDGNSHNTVELKS